jgi:hypothetical protein
MCINRNLENVCVDLKGVRSEEKKYNAKLG